MPHKRFFVFVAASLLTFVALLHWVTRARSTRPKAMQVALAASIVVVAGMFFARYGARAGLPVVVYYGVPALVTIALPPLYFKMSLKESFVYCVLAFAVSPLIHVVFSVALGWHEYLPFWHVPSVGEMLRGEA